MRPPAACAGVSAVARGSAAAVGAALARRSAEPMKDLPAADPSRPSPDAEDAVAYTVEDALTLEVASGLGLGRVVGQEFVAHARTWQRRRQGGKHPWWRLGAHRRRGSRPSGSIDHLDFEKNLYDRSFATYRLRVQLRGVSGHGRLRCHPVQRLLGLEVREEVVREAGFELREAGEAGVRVMLGIGKGMRAARMRVLTRRLSLRQAFCGQPEQPMSWRAPSRIR